MRKITLDEALAQGRGTERPFCCPVHDDSNASASLNVAKGVWYCHACKASGTVEGHVPSVEEIIKILAGEVEPRTYAESWLDLFDAYEPSKYWSDRVGLDTAIKHRCGTGYESGLPTYPMRDSQGRVLGVVTRHEGQKAKYMYPTGVRTSATFYGDLKPAQVIVLVEGAGDVMALDQSGIPEHWTVLGCFGSGLHAPQVQLLADLSPKIVVSAFDDDSAGQGATERAQFQLHDIAPVLSYQWSKVGGNDPGDVPIEIRTKGIVEMILNSSYKKYASN